MRKLIRSIIYVVLVGAWLPQAAPEQVAVDRIPNSLTLPPNYPDSWVFVYIEPQVIDFTLGSYGIVDITAQTREFKGAVQWAGFTPAIRVPSAGPEFYVAETILDRVGHGRRSDVVTVIDKASLDPAAEIMLPKGKRGLLEGNLMEQTGDGAFLLVYNFTPAASVSVIDVKKRRVVGEIPLPGCTSIYASGQHSFSSLCENGTMVTMTLGDKGQLLHESRSEAFNDIDHDVLFVEATTMGELTYFISEKGHVRPVGLSDGAAKVFPTWALMTREQVNDGWRTAAGRMLANDARGHLFVRMYRETGYEAQARANTEVWVYDVASKERMRRIPLQSGGDSIEVTAGEHPYLVVATPGDVASAAHLDVYEPQTGKLLHTIGGWPIGTQLQLTQARR